MSNISETKEIQAVNTSQNNESKTEILAEDTEALLQELPAKQDTTMDQTVYEDCNDEQPKEDSEHDNIDQQRVIAPENLSGPIFAATEDLKFNESEKTSDTITIDKHEEADEPMTIETSSVDFLDNILEQAEKKMNPGSNQDVSREDVEKDSSSGSSSDSSDSEGSSSDDDDNNDDFVDALEEEEDDGPNVPIKSKNEAEEQADELPEDFIIAENDAVEHIGEIISIVEKNIVIKGNLSGEFRFLKEGSVLCLEDKTPLGLLHEVFGPVSFPLYRVKFNKTEEMEKFKDKKGSRVFYVVPKSSFVYTDTIKVIKGTDASNWHDEELPEEEQEFSDDEKERESKQSKKKRKNKKANDEGEGNKKQKGQSSKWQHRQYNDPAPAPSQPVQNIGYQSRSQREQQTIQQNHYHQQAQSYRQPVAKAYANPSTFRAPPGMMSQVPQFPQMQGMPSMPMSMPPIPLMPPMPPFPANMNQEQMMQMQQQYVQMQQIMMQQFFQQQQGGNTPQGPPRR